MKRNYHYPTAQQMILKVWEDGKSDGTDSGMFIGEVCVDTVRKEVETFIPF